jgi:hypothetical protein
MVPFDIQTISKLDAAFQQVEAAIELFYAKKYAPAVTLAAAAEGCLVRPTNQRVDASGDLPVPTPLFEMMKRGAKERFGKTETEAVARFNKVAYWLKHETRKEPPTIEITNYEAFWMIARAVTKIEATAPGSETPTITRFIEFSREHYVPIPNS